jgi:hypothetical protein
MDWELLVPCLRVIKAELFLWLLILGGVFKRGT